MAVQRLSYMLKTLVSRERDRSHDPDEVEEGLAELRTLLRRQKPEGNRDLGKNRLGLCFARRGFSSAGEGSTGSDGSSYQYASGSCIVSVCLICRGHGVLPVCIRVMYSVCRPYL